MSEYRAVLAVENAVLSNVHAADECAGEGCWVHKPSAHPLRDAPVWVLRGDEIYRACVCFDRGSGEATGLHPDPDWMGWRQGRTRYVGWQNRFEHPCCEARHCRAADHAFDNAASESGVGRCVCGYETAHYALGRDMDPEFDEHLREAEARGESVRW